MENIAFLSPDDVLELHMGVIDMFGGSHGIRDSGLLDSAIEMPQAGSFGEYYHKTIFEMAAAYLYHLVKNHPFIDGNKRIGLACCEVFLELNGYITDFDEDEAYNLIINIASDNSITKQVIAQFLEKNAK